MKAMTAHNVNKEYTFLVLGTSGSGKSRLINVILEKNAALSDISTTLQTTRCDMYQFVYNEVLYKFIDTIGCGDDIFTTTEVLQRVKTFLTNSSISKLQGVFIVINGTERILKQEVNTLNNIQQFLRRENYLSNVLFCVSHADGWNEIKKTHYLKSFQTNSYLEIIKNVKLFFYGAPDPNYQINEYISCAEREENATREDLRAYLVHTHNPNTASPIIEKLLNLQEKQSSLPETRQIENNDWLKCIVS